jgi:hypothetical protein
MCVGEIDEVLPVGGKYGLRDIYSLIILCIDAAVNGINTRAMNERARIITERKNNFTD